MKLFISYYTTGAYQGSGSICNTEINVDYLPKNINDINKIETNISFSEENGDRVSIINWRIFDKGE